MAAHRVRSIGLDVALDPFIPKNFEYIIAKTIWDGTDAVMLKGESRAKKHPKSAEAAETGAPEDGKP